MKDVICQSTHPEDLDTGQVLGVGDTASVDEANPHNARLIEEGRLVIVPPTGSLTIDEVLADVGEDPEKAATALEVERAASKPRSTLIERLEAIAVSTPENPDQEASS